MTYPCAKGTLANLLLAQGAHCGLSTDPHRGPFLTGSEDDQFEVCERLGIGHVEKLEDTPGLQKGRAVHRSRGPCAILGPEHHLWPREGG